MTATAPAPSVPWVRRPDGWFRVLAAPVLVACLVFSLRRWPGLVPMAPTMSVSLLVLVVYGLVLLSIIARGVDRWRTLRWRPALVAGLWGGLVATQCALVANTAVQHDLDGLFGARVGGWLSTAAGPPVVEETLKAAGVLVAVVVAGRRLATPMEAMVLGAVSGLGFQLVEDVNYVHDGALADPDRDGLGAAHVLTQRLVGGFGSHWVLTALTGLGIGIVLAARGRARWWAIVPAVAALTLHATNNGLFGPVGVHVAPVAAVVVMIVATRVAHRLQWRAACRTLAADVDAPATDDERLELRTRRTARLARTRIRRAQGREAARQHARRQRGLMRRAVSSARAGVADRPGPADDNCPDGRSGSTPSRPGFRS